jgi:hypothetical protein
VSSWRGRTKASRARPALAAVTDGSRPEATIEALAVRRAESVRSGARRAAALAARRIPSSPTIVPVKSKESANREPATLRRDRLTGTTRSTMTEAPRGWHGFTWIIIAPSGSCVCERGGSRLAARHVRAFRFAAQGLAEAVVVASSVASATPSSAALAPTGLASTSAASPGSPSLCDER